MISVQHARYSTCGLLIDKSLDLRVPRQDSVVGSQTHHSTRMVIGTKAYMPPEYLQSGHMSVKTDSYAFGKTHVRLMGLFGCVVVLPLETANTAPFVLIRACYCVMVSRHRVDGATHGTQPVRLAARKSESRC